MRRQTRSILFLAAAGFLAALQLSALEQRSLQHSFPLPSTSETFRLANLAGRVTLVPATGSQLEVEATIFAEGRDAAETRRLLDGMQWVQTHDKQGRPEWALSYPVKNYRGFAYPRAGGGDSAPEWVESLVSVFGGTTHSTTYFLERKVSIQGKPSSSIPVLYADLRIAVPKQGPVAVRNVVGGVTGETLEGDLVVDTGSGSVEIAGFSGKLLVDTGSGRVTLGRVRGETTVDTGSGGIEIAELIGNGSLDTGSGAIRVQKVAAGKLVCDTGSGGVSVKNGAVGELLIDTGSGGVTVTDVEVQVFNADTGSGGVTLRSSLAEARDIRIDTGSGSVTIEAGENASFDIATDLGSGNFSVDYPDATLRKEGHRLVGAQRGNRKPRIVVETGSGGCQLRPAR